MASSVLLSRIKISKSLVQLFLSAALSLPHSLAWSIMMLNLCVLRYSDLNFSTLNALWREHMTEFAVALVMNMNFGRLLCQCLLRLCCFVSVCRCCNLKNCSKQNEIERSGKATTKFCLYITKIETHTAPCRIQPPPPKKQEEFMSNSKMLREWGDHIIKKKHDVWAAGVGCACVYVHKY